MSYDEMINALIRERNVLFKLLSEDGEDDNEVLKETYIALVMAIRTLKGHADFDGKFYNEKELLIENIERMFNTTDTDELVDMYNYAVTRLEFICDINHVRIEAERRKEEKQKNKKISFGI